MWTIFEISKHFLKAQTIFENTDTFLKHAQFPKFQTFSKKQTFFETVNIFLETLTFFWNCEHFFLEKNDKRKRKKTDQEPSIRFPKLYWNFREGSHNRNQYAVRL